jgi:coenzyme F420-reducing hydrogenase beta subunit/polysaccharide pyruvyl transferase WcaK-like protein
MLQVRNISSVVLNNLCNSCGSCAGICPKGCISLDISRSGILLEPKVNELHCIHCGLCIKVCPGIGWDVNDLLPEEHQGSSVDYLGNVSNCYIGFSQNNEIRFNSASGGIVSELLIYLLENGYIDGAIVSRMIIGSPLETETFIATTKDQILSSAKSIYCPVPVGKILSEIMTKNGKYAFVGLPCHIAGLRKAQRKNKLLNERIIFTIGLFCSRTPNYQATNNLLNNIGVDKKEISNIEYRGRGHPGKLRIALKNGSEIFVDHLDYRYWGYTFQYNFKPLRCWLCHDHSAMLADISCGDNWINTGFFQNDKLGSSIIIVRTLLMEEILSQMVKINKITLEKVTDQQIIDSQNLRLKSNVTPNFQLMKFLQMAVPDNHPINETKVKIIDRVSSLSEFINIQITNNFSNQRLLNIFIKSSYFFQKILYNGLINKIKSFFRTVKKSLNILAIKQSNNSYRQSHKKKIVLMGGFGWKDIGDEAMPHGVIYNLKKRIPDLEIVMLSPDPSLTEEFHKEKAIQEVNYLSFDRYDTIRKKCLVFITTLLFIVGAYMQRYNIKINLWPNARNVLDEISSSALLYNNGGGNLNSIIPSELYKKCTLYWAAKILKKPVIISGQTMGPYTNFFDRWYCKFCLNKVDFISFRDKYTSRDRLIKIGVTKPIMINAADDAMTIPKISKADALDIVKKEAPQAWLEYTADCVIVMNMKGSMSLFHADHENIHENEIITIMAKLTDQLIEKYNSKVFYLPTDYSKSVDDRVLHREIVKQMKHSTKVFCIENEYSDSTLKGLISIADTAIGSRYHFCVFAASENIPFLGLADGIYQKTKLKGLSDLCELPNTFYNEKLSLDNLDLIWDFIVKFMTNQQEIKEQLRKIIPILKEKSLSGVIMAEKILMSNTTIYMKNSIEMNQ